MSKRLIYFLLLLSFIGCGSKAHHKPPSHPDYRPPVWHPVLVYDGVPVSACPTLQEVQAVYDKVSLCWLDYYRSKGASRPSTMPGPGQVVSPTVTFVPSCSNSAEMPGDGPWGLKVKAAHCTVHGWETQEFMLKAIGHRLCHVFVVGSGGNAMHDFYKSTCGY